MPVTAAGGEEYQVKIVGRIDGQETNNIMHFSCPVSDSDVDLHLIQVIAQCFIDHLLPVLSSAWTLEKVVWKRVSPTLGPEFTSIPVGAGAGGGSASALPSFCSAVLSIRTAQGGRSKRGRQYIAGIPEEATLNSTIDSTSDLWEGLVAYALCLITGFSIGDPPVANTWQFVLYSRKIGGATFPYGNSGFTPVTDMFPVSQIGTTRSRKVGRGS